MPKSPTSYRISDVSAMLKQREEDRRGKKIDDFKRRLPRKRTKEEKLSPET